MNAKEFYGLAPHSLKYVLLNIYSASLYRERYGNTFQELMVLLDKTQWYSKAEIKDYQDKALSRLVEHCYTSVPYYRALFDEYGLVVSDIQGVNDLKKIPILTKQRIREESARLISTATTADTRKIKFGGTSGTTGTPLKIGWDQRSRIFNSAVDWRQKQWGGVTPGDPIVMLLGQPIVSLDKQNPPFWQHDRVQNFLWMSAFHMNASFLPSYIQKIKRFKPVAIEGYPSTLFELAKFVEYSGDKIELKAIFSSSEPLHAHYREKIENVFGCRVYDFYGLAERTMFATQCDKHEGQHINFEYGITEILDSDGANSKSGVMVTTSLHNYGMPLLRYQISDHTSLIAEPCSCGRSMPRVHQITTKMEDMIYRSDGTPISPSILTHPFKLIQSIEKSQIIQTGFDAITIKIVKNDAFTSDDHTSLLKNFQDRVGADMAVNIDFVSDIPPEKSGKFRWVIREIQ